MNSTQYSEIYLITYKMKKQWKIIEFEKLILNRVYLIKMLVVL